MVWLLFLKIFMVLIYWRIFTSVGWMKKFKFFFRKRFPSMDTAYSGMGDFVYLCLVWFELHPYDWKDETEQALSAMDER